MKRLILMIFFLTGTTSVFANTVTYTVNQPATITYQVVRQYRDADIALSDHLTATVQSSVSIPVTLNGAQYVGIITDTINGHALPLDAKQFGQPNTCTVRTSRAKPAGELRLTMQAHKITCSH